ncbi:MAG TPA: extracellular solute-binding protein [Pseudolabrys sp.]|nr:extracellular solute-binding protein [Pseudolabrys sp.]
MNRRAFLTSAAVLFTAQRVGLPAWADAADGASGAWRHGVSKFGDLKYAAGFKQFDYVNATAPKGGSASQIALGTFDNLNMVVAGVKGTLAQGIDMIHDTLFVASLDEVSSAYGLIAESVSYPDDVSSATFRLRANAKWHDGKPITPDDVIFSFESFKKISPQAAANYKHVVKAEKIGPRDVKFTFEGGNHELPHIVGQLTILPQHWWQAADKDGKKRSVGETTLEPPLGSGPYRIKEFSPGHNIVYERVKDYWGKDLNVNVGRDNFDEVRYEYFRDATVAIEAFKANTVDWRTENSAKNWATAYDFPAVKDGRVILEEFPISNIGIMQAFCFNIRRDKFKDPRVRLAFNYAFDFDELNKQLFFGQYKRITSYFEGTDLAARGLPEGRELELLQAVRDKIPPEVFTKPYSNPGRPVLLATRGLPAASGGSQPDNSRANMREALRLMRQAGYEVREQQLVNAKTGEPFAVEFLANAPLFERIFLFYKPSLERLGITVSVRTVDEAQYENRLRSWDFDVIVYAWGESLLPGAELRGFFGSQSADVAGSDNVIGIKNPAVDAMIDKVVAAKSEQELVAAARALDRILLWNYYVVPQWTYGKVRTARWNRFSRPQNMPKYGMAAFPALWWWDEAKVAKTGTRQ